MIKRMLGICLLPLLLLAACGEDSDPTRNNDFVPLTGITIDSARGDIPFGFTIQFTAEGDFSGAFSRDITTDATWSSSDPALLTFDDPNRGLGRGVAPGPVTVFANLNGAEGIFSFTVSNATLQSIAVTPNPAGVAKGGTQRFQAIGTFSDSLTLDITSDVTWSSAGVTIATVEAGGLAKGVDLGSTEIIATYSGITPAVTGAATLTVTAPSVTGIRLSPEPPILIVNETWELSALRVLSDDTTEPVASAVWSSSHTNIATVDAATGVVTARAVGTTTISAADAVSGLTGTATVTVGAVNSIEVTPAVTTDDQIISIGESLQLRATATMSNNTTRDITSVATWTLSNNQTQAVSLDSAVRGRVIGNAAGVADVTANVGTGDQRVSGTIRITVTQ
ncbi:MAG: Ig-like domain-containing protein [Desulfuromonadales bacterium]|nr:Ig-like domain-containing protein [Desulfuromonadales bacterium]